MSTENFNGINRNAVFCDESPQFCRVLFISENQKESETEKGPVNRLRIRIQTEKNDCTGVILYFNGKPQTMQKEEGVEWLDYYFADIDTDEERADFYFRLEGEHDSCLYDKLGAFDGDEARYPFLWLKNFTIPKWAEGAVIYQIFTDRFFNGNPANDVEDDEYCYIQGECVKKIEDWYRYPSSTDVHCFYGGDLQGVREKFDYLKTLGVEVIYFNPLFVSPSNHKYDTQDYDYIDPHYTVIVDDSDKKVDKTTLKNNTSVKYIKRVCGKNNLEASNAFFAVFMEEAHKAGFRVILDGVFNHCGSFNKWLDREGIYREAAGYEAGAYLSADSPYRSFFKFFDENAWPDNTTYDGWWGHDTLPKLHYENSPELVQYILDIGKKWVSPPYMVDGWRLDVAADLGYSQEYNHWFWKQFRTSVKEANPEALILAEHYGDVTGWLKGDEWDTVMNYDAFMEPVTWYLTGMEKHSDARNEAMEGDGRVFFETMKANMAKFYYSSLLSAMNELSNHDHSRFLTRTNRKVGRIGTLGPEAASEGICRGTYRSAVTIQMTWPGAPTVYYGDEVGLCGWTDPDNRRTYPWNKEDLELLEFHKVMIAIHKQFEAFRRGSLKFLLVDGALVAYGRFTESEKALVIINHGPEKEASLPVWMLGEAKGSWERIMLTTNESYNCGILKVLLNQRDLAVSMPENSSAVYINR